MYGAQTTSELKADVAKKKFPGLSYTKQCSTKLKYHLKSFQQYKKISAELQKL